MFWNDSLLSDPENSLDGVANLIGKTNAAHQWKNRGTNNANPEVIDTWFYSSIEKTDQFVACPLLLNIELKEFEVNYQHKQNILHWRIDDDKELDKYEIQKSNYKHDFHTFDSIDAMQTAEYFYPDKNPSFGQINYYRLKMDDKSGGAYYSNIISIEVPEGSGQPILELINHKIRFITKGNTLVHFKLYNLLGSLQFEEEVENGQWLDLPQNEHGIYLLEFDTDSGIKQIKKIWLN